jgi:hypothetical protein
VILKLLVLIQVVEAYEYRSEFMQAGAAAHRVPPPTPFTWSAIGCANAVKGQSKETCDVVPCRTHWGVEVAVGARKDCSPYLLNDVLSEVFWKGCGSALDCANQIAIQAPD